MAYKEDGVVHPQPNDVWRMNETKRKIKVLRVEITDIEMLHNKKQGPCSVLFQPEPLEDEEDHRCYVCSVPFFLETHFVDSKTTIEDWDTEGTTETPCAATTIVVQYRKDDEKECRDAFEFWIKEEGIFECYKHPPEQAPQTECGEMTGKMGYRDREINMGWSVWEAAWSVARNTLRIKLDV